MNLVVYEHITSGALCDESLPASLAHEGESMLFAIVQDLLLLGQIHLTILQDARLDPHRWEPYAPQITIKTSASRLEFETHWQTTLSEQSFFLLIAPETDNILYALQQQVLQAGKHYLGCSLQATQICTDKRQSYQQLVQANIPTPTTFSADKALLDSCLIDQPYIVKPVDGAGCLDTHKFATLTQTRDFLLGMPPSHRANFLVQPYIEGEILSLTIYRSAEALLLLSINQQLIEQQAQQFVFHGCVTNFDHSKHFSRQQAMKLAGSVDDAIDGLAGYIGIDFILTAQGPVVVDINPRLTTAYVNLSHSGQSNPAHPLWQNLQRLIHKETSYA